jgi:methylamine dehydrogenase heavy chain
MLCGDGKVASVTLDEAGQAAERAASDKLFDADQDPWFHHAEQVGDRLFTISFKGLLNELDLSAATPRLLRSQSMVKAADAKAGWRPGGYQAFTVSPDGRQAVVAMHDKGGEGTHKSPAKALWVVDTATAQRTASLPGHATVSLTFSHNGQRLQALDGMTGALHVWAWNAARPQPLKLLTKVAKAGETSTQLESHD